MVDVLYQFSESIPSTGDRRADVPILMLHESFILDHGKRRHRRFASFARVDRSSFAVRDGTFVLLAYPEEVNRVEPAWLCLCVCR